MSKSLFVPIRIEGLFLTENSYVCSPLADFEKLPWNDGSQDYNYETPFLGDSIVNVPFSDRNCQLMKGLHLHFILPHFLGQPVPNESGLANAGELPAAPNFWVIIKKDSGGTVQGTYYIQSDYIYADENDLYENVSNRKVEQPYSSVIPFGTLGSGSAAAVRPYAFMGKQGQNPYTSERSFKNIASKPLTVIGYGDINFSSFYPNCKGVFGFYDATADLNSNAQYEIYGWVNDEKDDILFQYTQINQASPNLKDRLASLFHTQICDAGSNNPSDQSQLPSIDGRTIYYARFVCDNHPIQFQNESQSLDIKIAIGNSGTEAMAAMLASSYPADQKSIVEEQLESVNLHSKLGPLLGDLGPKFHEARHTKGFNSVSGGYKWTITANGSKGQKGEAILVGEAILAALNDLNNSQHEYDTQSSQLVTLKEQLYMDWVKYMRLAYPAPDGIDNELLLRMKVYLDKVLIPEVQNKAKSCGEIKLFKGDKEYEGMDCIDLIAGDEVSLAYAVLMKWQVLFELLKGTANKYIISCTPANYYWQPKPPVLLLSGLFSESNDADILKKAGNNNEKVYAGDWNFMPNNTAISAPSLPKDNTQKLSAQVTNPFILEWETDLLDTALLTDEKGEIHANALSTCVQIKENGADFEKTPYFQTGELSVFSGSVIMSPHARKTMVHRLLEFIKAHQSDYFTLTDKDQKNDCDTFCSTEDVNVFLSLLSKQMGVLESRTPKFSVTNPAKYRILVELQTLLLDHSILSQTLSGFNHACMMQGMTAQLPILDPMGFADTQGLTQKVAAIMGHMKRHSPLMGFLFNPIRSGSIRLNRLDLIDNFGVVTAVPIPTNMVWAETMKDNTGNPFLRPRLTQPSRLHFDFLDANKNSAVGAKTFSQLARALNLPESSPICGWLVPNYLNNDLMVFDSSGTALGYLSKDAIWGQPPYPTPNAPSTTTGITNEHLRRVVKWLEGNQALLGVFLDSVQSAQDNIAPSHASTFKSQAILMGKPIAVARAVVHFQLKGLPVINQSWNALVSDISNNAPYMSREKKNWTNVEIPFRLGEHWQLDDGLIGYWMEDDKAATDDKVLDYLVAPESTNPNSTEHVQVETFGSYKKLQESISINETKIATLLLDPRSGVHCTSGIVPTVTTSIDPSLFLPAMQKLEMWFQMSAILQPTETLAGDAVLNLPAIDGKEWHWYDQFNTAERNIAKDETDGFKLTANTIKESFLTLKNKK